MTISDIMWPRSDLTRFGMACFVCT